MKIIFFGTPEFAIPSLKVLLQNKYEIVGVVTVPDKLKGRGLKPEPSPVKVFAIENNLKILQPENLRDISFQDEIKKLSPDVGVVVAYRILPVEVYTIPRFGTFNLHASLLPKYRGAAPIQWALINGEKVTGVTTFFLQEKVDTGNIILQREVEILEEDNFQTLHDKLAKVGSQLVLETVKRIETGNFETIPQKDEEATLAPKITKEICQINWNQKAEKIHNLVRALSPSPAAQTRLKNKLFKILKTKVTSQKSTEIPGRVIVESEKLLVNTSDYLISIEEIQPESRKRMTIKEFLLGYKHIFNDDTRFE